MQEKMQKIANVIAFFYGFLHDLWSRSCCQVGQPKINKNGLYKVTKGFASKTLEILLQWFFVMASKGHILASTAWCHVFMDATMTHLEVSQKSVWRKIKNLNSKTPCNFIQHNFEKKFGPAWSAESKENQCFCYIFC